jgi:hypothetical protein
MVDVTTRSWELTDDALLAHFECHFPQTLPWTLCQLRKPMSFALTSALFTRRYAPELLFNGPKPKTSIGRGGTNFSSTTTLTHSYAAGKTLSRSSKSLDIAIETDDLPPTIIPSKLEQWRGRYVRSARRSPGWGPRTSKRTSTGTSTTEYNVKSEPISEKIPPEASQANSNQHHRVYPRASLRRVYAR